MNRSIMITGANVGLGKETARQFALIDGTEKVYLACRNEGRAVAAKQDLEASTGRSIFEIVIMDVSDPTSVRTAVASLAEPIDALIMNAGGMGGRTPNAKTANGVTHIVASNAFGHIILLDELLQAKKLTKVALYAGSEAIRGVKKMGIKPVILKTSSADEFASICDGSFFAADVKPLVSYGFVKYAAVMSLFSTARKNSDVRILSMSPGGTNGTNVTADMGGFMKFMFKVMGKTLMPLMGMMHKLEVGGKRFVDGINDDKTYKSGIFYGSTKNTTGLVSDQSLIMPELKNETFQDNANEAIHRFI
ncbi:MAG: NAD(P)-dependent dehydrogenase (short-subunit alcohol dehydrogenase family) [Crocinitomicaceae bacterium]|jgi:NAD(P)-dependent dehydrogenase (short-subunit alcohol dehydrogenase family)